VHARRVSAEYTQSDQNKGKTDAKCLVFTGFCHYNVSFTTKRAGNYRPFFLVDRF